MRAQRLQATSDYLDWPGVGPIFGYGPIFINRIIHIFAKTLDGQIQFA